jgi:hypothetical protein
MSRFTGLLATRELDVDLETWVLLEDLVWEIGDIGTNMLIVVPVGFAIDGATVPKPLSYVISRWGRYRRAACLHDQLCRWMAEGEPSIFCPTRWWADQYFWEACEACGVSYLMRWILYAGVRLGAVLGIGTPRGA